MSHQLYIVWMAGGETGPAQQLARSVKLHDGLWITASQQTRSKLYHHIKHQCLPERLLVAPLADIPKFKGMMAGTTRAVRELEQEAGTT